MIKNILILSSDYTGHGHKSITDSLAEQFEKHPDVNVHIVDGFALAGNVGMRVGKMYGSVTRNAKELWRIVWDVSLRRPDLINEVTESMIRVNFLKLLRKVKPDVILSVHPSFNGSVLNILEYYNIKIPFITFIADLVSITPLWADPRVDYILCPTIESKYKSLEFGVSESKLIVTGFPVRSRFCRHIYEGNENHEYDINKPLRCLIMSGGEGVGNMNTIAKILLRNFNCEVKIIAGRNNLLRRRLERTLQSRYPDKVNIYGFVKEIEELMLDSDIAFTRGSPNVMMEAVHCNVPVVITSALPGQEEGNPNYMVKNCLGVICKEVRKVKKTVSDLLENNAKKLNDIKKAQREFRNPETASEIVEFILNMQKNTDVVLPDVLPRVIRKSNLIKLAHVRKKFKVKNLVRMRKKFKFRRLVRRK